MSLSRAKPCLHASVAPPTLAAQHGDVGLRNRITARDKSPSLRVGIDYTASMPHARPQIIDSESVEGIAQFARECGDAFDLDTKAPSSVRFAKLPVPAPEEAGRSLFMTTCSQSQQLGLSQPLEQCHQQDSISVMPPRATLAIISAQTSLQSLESAHIRVSQPLRHVGDDHGTQIGERHRFFRTTDDPAFEDNAILTQESVPVPALTWHRRFSADNGSKIHRRCRRLLQRRSTAPLPHQVVLAFRPSPLSRTAASTSVENTRSPRVLRHLYALNSPGKRHWTPVERLCCEVRATEEDYVGDLRRMIEGFFIPLASRAADAAIRLGPLSELHAATHFLLQVHEELLALMSAGDTDRSETRRCSDGDSSTCSVDATSSLSRDSDANSVYDDDGADMDDDMNRPNQHSYRQVGIVRRPTVNANHIAKAFVSTAQFMKAYSIYCAAHRPATDELDTLQKRHPRLLHNLGTSTASVKMEMPMMEFPEILSELIKPVQRICRYPMLLRSLVDQSVGSYTPGESTSHSNDTALLRQALDVVEHVSDLVNARVRDAQNNARLLELFATLPDSGKGRAAAVRPRLLQPARTFVTEVRGAVSVTRVAPRWRWLRKCSSLLLKLHAFCCLRGFSSDIDEDDSRRREMHERLAECGHDGNGDYPRRSPCTSDDCTGGATAIADVQGGRGEPSRLILLSDVLLMAKKCTHKLQVRRQICLSCAVIMEDNMNTFHNHEDFALVLVAAKVGRCHCHQLIPATLQIAKRTCNSTTSLDGLIQHGNIFAAIGSRTASARSNDREYSTSGRWLCGAPRPFRASRRYLLRFDSARIKNDFATQLQDAIAKSARVEPPPLPTPRSSRLPSCSSRRTVARLWRPLAHLEMPASPATRSTTPDATRPDKGTQALDRLGRRRHASVDTSLHRLDDTGTSVASPTESLSANAVFVRVLDNRDDSSGNFV